MGKKIFTTKVSNEIRYGARCTRKLEEKSIDFLFTIICNSLGSSNQTH